MSDIRQEFEAKFKMPEGVKYGSHDGTRTYFAESREYRREADTYRHLWLGYQAAHKAQQAEIERLKAHNKLMHKTLYEARHQLDTYPQEILGDGHTPEGQVYPIRDEMIYRFTRALEGNQ